MTALEEIRGRMDAATPGPWHWTPNASGNPSNGPDHHIIRSGDAKDPLSQFPIAQTDYDEMGSHDAEFIANAPTDMSRLLNAVQAVLDLHERIECTDEDGEPTGFFACEECKDHDEVSRERVHEVWPCPTVQAITSALETKS